MKEKKKKSLSAFTILFLLIAIMAVLTWFLPAGKYMMMESNGRMAPVAGSYMQTDSTPQGILNVLAAPIKGIEDGIDVVMYILMIGGFLGVVMRANVVDTAVISMVNRLRGRETMMIIILILFFGLGGTTYGMGEETIAFYPLIVPVILAAGYDTVTAASIILMGSVMGCLASTVNPFATGIASRFAETPIGDGLIFRGVMFLVGMLLVIAYTLYYANKVKRDPEKSLTYDTYEENMQYFLRESNEDVYSAYEFTTRLKAAFILFTLVFAFMVYALIPFSDFGVTFLPTLGWSFHELSIYFLFSGIVIGLVAGLTEQEIIDGVLDGISDIVSVALILGISRGITVIMNDGNISATILHYGELLLNNFGKIPFIVFTYLFYIPMSFLIPSSSGLATMSMPIMAPLADFAGVSRSLVVTAYQSASGFMNFFTPTSGIVMGGLAMSKVPYDKWLKYIAKFLVIITLLNIGFLVGAIVLGLA